jgi:citrate lyase subunit beta / citryl-CoA lyase
MLPDRLATLLFVPATDPGKIAKAVASSASIVVIDLEDAVADAEKTRARTLAAAALGDHADAGRSLVVRINALSSGLADDDLVALAPQLAQLDAIALPKVAAPEEIRALAARLDVLERQQRLKPGSVEVLPLVETSAGVLAAPQVAGSSPRLRTLMLGSADLAHELDVDSTAEGTEHLHARATLVLACAAARKAPPIDGPYVVIGDDEGTRRSASTARGLGFQGKIVIHPRQLEIVDECFRPTEQGIAWARAVDDAFRAAELAGRASLKLPDGSFVDYAVARRARSILEAHAPGLTEP